MPDQQKQIVQWFPGHMAKTRRLIKESLPLVDCVTELLDARVPFSSRNPELDELTQQKPRIVLLNKCDMADEKTTALWIEWFRKQGKAALAVDCRSGKGLNRYQATVQTVLADKIRANNEKAISTGGVVIACGVAKYEGDDCVAAVFERADRSMYEDKSRLKAGQ